MAVLGLAAIGQAPWVSLKPAEAKKIRDGYFALLSKARTIHIVELDTHEKETMRIEDWLMKPYAKMLYEEPVANGGPNHRAVSYMFKDKTFDVDPQAKTYEIFPRWPGSPFINGLEPYLQGKRPAYTVDGKVFEGAWNGKQVYKIETGPQSIPGSMVSVFIGQKDLVPVGWEYAVKNHGSQWFSYQTFQMNAPMSTKDFAWSPPAGYRLKADLRSGLPPRH